MEIQGFVNGCASEAGRLCDKALISCDNECSMNVIWKYFMLPLS